jgi:hypothetical protein
MAFGIATIAHAVLAVFLIIELGLMAYLVDWWWSPSSYNFMLFNTIWSILVLLYLALTTTVLTRFFHAMVALGLLIVTTIFWFAGSIAMAAWLGVPNCHHSTPCGSAQAAIAFGFFIWAIFLGLTVLEGMAFMRGRGPSAHADTKPGHSSGHSFA